MLAIFYGLGAALSWGAGDFTGGLASRRTGAYLAVLCSELVGIGILAVFLLTSSEPAPSRQALLLAMLAGGLGSVGLLFLYHSMTLGLMSIAAPVSALLAAALPVVVGAVTEGLPSLTTLIGFGFALFAVWMVSRGAGGVKDLLSHISDLRLPLFAGIGFGLYFVVMHAATRSGGLLWPMFAARLGGMALVFLYLLYARIPLTVERSAWPLISINGVLDIGGNAFFVLAGQAGRLDVAAVLSGLFPGATVLLAWIFLRERLKRDQWIGILSALVAIVCFTV